MKELLNKEELIYSGERLILWNPKYRAVSKWFLKRMRPFVPEVKKILKGKNEYETHLPITIRKTPRALTFDTLAYALTEKFMCAVVEDERQNSLRKSIKLMYKKRLALKRNFKSISPYVVSILNPKIEKARDWLKETKKPYIDKALWESYTILKDCCVEKGTNKCPEVFVKKILLGLYQLFEIGKSVEPESSLRRIHRIIKRTPKDQQTFSAIWNSMRQRENGIKEFL